MTSIPLADWAHPVTEIPPLGLSRERAISADALGALANTLGMLSLDDAKISYRIERLAGGAYRLHGGVVANGTQACVVTVEPVPSHVEDTFDVEFWPDLPEPDGGEEKSVLDARDVERLEGGSIPVGRIVFETLSAGLDPYPRKPDAEFSWPGDASQETQNISPFAALSKLKTKP
jgi:hypothetical protein